VSWLPSRGLAVATVFVIVTSATGVGVMLAEAICWPVKLVFVCVSVAVLDRVPAPPSTSTVMTTDPDVVSAIDPMVQVTVGTPLTGASDTVPMLARLETYTIPVGSGSVTTTPLAAAGPLSWAEIVYVSSAPSAGAALLTVFVIDTLAAVALAAVHVSCWIAVRPDVVVLSGLETVASGTKPPVLLGVTVSSGTLIGGKEVPGSIGSRGVYVHVSVVAPAAGVGHTQPLPAGGDPGTKLSPVEPPGMVTTVVTGASSAEPVPSTFVVNVAVAMLPAVTLTGPAADSDNCGKIGRIVETVTPLISWISFDPPVLADQPNFTVGVVARRGGSASVNTGVVAPSTYTRI
jgi:hypothetical protein